MRKEDYLATPAWRELERADVHGRPTLVWRERPRHVLDLLDLSVALPALDLLVQGDRRISFGAFRDAVERGAAELARLGIGRGDRVFIVLFNSPEFLFAEWAAWRVGAVPTLGNRWWSARDLSEMIARLRPAALISDIELPASALGATAFLPLASVAQWAQLPPPPVAAPDPRGGVDEDEVALIEFTAGSTGVPKAVQISHRNLVWTQQTLHVMRGSRPPAPTTPAGQRVALMTTPMFHNGAVVAGISALMDGNRMAILRGKFDPLEVLSLIEAERVNSWNAVPTMFKRVLEHPRVAEFDLSSLVAPSTGGMMVPPGLLDLVARKLPAAAGGFSIGFGMTEASFLTITAAADVAARPGSVGKPIPGVELRVDNPDPQGEGELLARSGAVMVGYLDAAERPIDAEGWYHTGDLGRIEPDGCVILTGRAKDMIIRGGENISCAHVEGVIARHPDVLEVAVVGYADEEFGEAVAAVVHARPGSTVNEATLAAFAAGDLAHFERPTRWLFTPDPLPVLPTGKIDKRGLGREIMHARG